MEDRAKVDDFSDHCTLFMDTLFRQLNSRHYQTWKHELRTKLTELRESQVFDYKATAAALDKLVYKHTKEFSAIDDK